MFIHGLSHRVGNWYFWNQYLKREQLIKLFLNLEGIERTLAFMFRDSGISSQFYLQIAREFRHVNHLSATVCSIVEWWQMLAVHWFQVFWKYEIMEVIRWNLLNYYIIYLPIFIILIAKESSEKDKFSFLLKNWSWKPGRLGRGVGPRSRIKPGVVACICNASIRGTEPGRHPVPPDTMKNDRGDTSCQPLVSTCTNTHKNLAGF